MPGNPDLRLALDAVSKLKVVNDYRARLAALEAQHGHSIAILSDGKDRMDRFNCFAYALGLWDNPDYIRAVDSVNDSAILNSALISAMINDEVLSELPISQATEGDVMVYFHKDRPMHAAVIASAVPPLVLRSKWGGNEVHQHGLWEVPADYGDRVCVFKSARYCGVPRAFAHQEGPRLMSRYTSSDTVCATHFNDEGLKEFVANHADSTECTVCGTTSENNIAAPLDDVTEHIATCIGQHYDDPANRLPYESAEGGYQGVTYTTEELFDEVGLEILNDRDGSLYDAIVFAMPTDLWSDAEPFMLTRSEQLHFSWESFCELIKHKRRYFFATTQSKEDEDSELHNPSEILHTIFAYAREADAFVILPRGSHLFRARLEKKGEHHATALALGPPAVGEAVQTNRMSPPGIVMTYVADDAETALAETANKPGRFALGEFVTGRDALILDLTKLCDAPSVFAELPDSLEYDPRVQLNFLHHISREISKPIARDDRVHVEYVPTQVVTEYVRTAVTIDCQPVAGIRYKACKAAGVIGVTFHDLRGTAVTRLALAGCTEAEIATVTGHSLRSVRALLDTHYLNRDPALGESAIRKLEQGTKTPN